MNISLIHYAAPPIVGGVETVIARQAQLLTRAGHKVQILAGRGETWDASIPVNIIPCIDSRHPEVLKNKVILDKGKIPEDFSSLIEKIQNELLRFLEGEDVIILHNVASLHKNLALTAALHNIQKSKLTTRFIIWHHDLAWTSSRYKAEMHDGWPWDLLRQPWGGAKQVTVSKARRKELTALSGLDPDEITVVSAGLDIADFLNLNSRTLAVLDKINILLSDPILLAPVRITRRKNLKMAIRICAELVSEFPRTTLMITGPPGAHNPHNLEYMKELQALRKQLRIEKSVHLLAEFMPEGLPDVCISDFYRIADALLITSKEEGFGIPILEAGLSSLPIFCTDLPPLRALAGKYATYFSPAENPKRVSKQIIHRLHNDPAYQLKVRVRHKYTWTAVYHRQIAPLLENE